MQKPKKRIKKPKIITKRNSAKNKLKKLVENDEIKETVIVHSPTVLEPIGGIVSEKNDNALIEWVQGRSDMLPPDMKRTVSDRNERTRLALNHLASKSVCSMAETQRFIHLCSDYLFRQERLATMTDEEISQTMMTALAVFDREAKFVTDVADVNKDLQAPPDQRTRLMDMIDNLPKDILEKLLENVKRSMGK